VKVRWLTRVFYLKRCAVADLRLFWLALSENGNDENSSRCP
jgi:hypothetical protein